MTAMLSWCWEAAQGNHGPDWRFLAVIAPEGIAELEQVAAQATPPEFSPCGLEETYCPYHQRTCLVHTFIDTHGVAAYRRNQEPGHSANIWIYNSIQIHRDIILIESGYGGRGAAVSDAETRLLVSTLSRPTIALQHWEVLVGGNGYPYQTLHAGTGLDALLAYLGHRP